MTLFYQNFNTLSLTGEASLPFSQKYIITNGISILVKILIVCLFSIFIYNSLYRNKYVTNIRKKVLNSEDTISLIAFCSVVIVLVFLGLISINISTGGKKIIYYTFFCFKIFIIIIFLINFKILYKNISNNLSDNYKVKKSKFNSNMLKGLFLIIAGIMIIYLLGVGMILEKLVKHEIDNTTIEFANIYDENNKTKTYYPIDISNEYFIGVDTSNNMKMSIIPKTKIKKIELWPLLKEVQSKKYISEKDMSNYLKAIGEDGQCNTYKEIVSIILNYYDFRINLKNNKSKEFIELLSEDYYKNQYDFIDPDILWKLWSKTNKYNDYDLKEFIGFELTIPKKNKNEYTVYVKEIFANTSLIIKYSFIYENKKWKINNVNIDSTPVKFR